MWFGGTDTPIPPGPPETTSAPDFTVAVAGYRLGDRVLLRYVVDGRQGQMELGRLRTAKRAGTGEDITFLHGELTGLRAGAQVQYTIVLERRHPRGLVSLPSPDEQPSYTFRFIYAGKGNVRKAAADAKSEMTTPGNVTAKAMVRASEARRQFFGTGAREAVSDTAVAAGEQPHVVGGTRSPKEVPPSGEKGPTPSREQSVSGQILIENGLPAANVRLRIYQHGFGGVTILLKEMETDQGGLYDTRYVAAKGPANIEIRAVAAGGEIPLSKTVVSVGEKTVLNLVAPASVQPQIGEFRQLAADLTGQVGGFAELAKTRESDQRNDLTFLHEATGWDARLIAVAANSAKLRAEVLAERQIDLPEDGIYAMLRAGLPSEKEQLARVGADAVEEALKKAGATGIVELDAQRVAVIKSSFQKFSRETRLDAKAPGAPSTYRELLSLSGLKDDKQEKFADVYLAHQGTPEELWKKAEESGLDKQDVNQLRLQGRLAYLTNNNADLTQSLQAEAGDADDLSKLVEKDLHTPEAWKTRLQQLSGNDSSKLAQLIPPTFANLDAYVEDMARKVEASFPNHVIARMVKKENLLGNDGDSDALHRFLNTAAKLDTGGAGRKGFKLGEISVDKLIDLYTDKFFPVGTPRETIEKTTKAARLIQRVYQFTPSNDAMKVLLARGLTSAHDVTAISKSEFLNRYGHYFLSTQDAELVYDKASQVAAVTHNVAGTARQVGREARPFAIGGTGEQQNEETKKLQARLLKHYPTMESLFGSMDFCDCEHCRSVLSPAAYLVDLLAFIDPDQKTIWDGFLEDWKSKHNGVAYTDAPYEYMKPFDALVKRRPDLPYLPLTCENTNTALPYIDLVNEILEFYVAHGGLTKSAVRDTGNATTAELLAEPQNVIAAAYEQLSAGQYPLALPFDLWLETVRRFFDHFDTPLWQVLDVFRTTDKLLPPKPPETPKASYYRAEIFAEQLGLSPSEYALFTNPERLENWQLLYGFDDPGKTAPANQQDALTALKSAKTLSRRLGVSYKEIAELVQTTFVNPRLEGLSFLTRVEISADDFFRYKGQPGHAPLTTDEKAVFDQRLVQRAEELKLSVEALSTRIDAAWTATKVNEILVLRDPNAACNFDQTTIEYLDGKPADSVAFLKLNLFVRLWRKLGWTIAETDRALQTFLPANLQPLTPVTIGPALETALLYLAHFKALDSQLKVGRNSRLKLLTLWSDLATTGTNSLYAQLFLTRSVLKNDVVFDDPLGQYLSAPGILRKVKDHLVAVQGALGVTADEIGRILADSKGMPASEGAKLIEAESLTLGAVSLIYRYILLAKALRLSVADLIALKRLSGLNPFKPLSANRAQTMEDDFPFSQTVRFVEIAALISETGFKIADLDYILRHRFDPVGKYRRDPNVVLTLVKSLALEIRRIQTEHNIPADPATLTDEVLQQKLALALPGEVATTFFAMWAGTKEYLAASLVPPAQMLAPDTFASEPAVRVSYNEERQEQRLAFRGVLLDAKKAEINATAPSPLVAALLDAVQKQAKDFFQTHIQRSGAEEPQVGFLETGDFEKLFAAPPPIPEDRPDTEKQALRKRNEELGREKRRRLAKAFLAFLQQKLIRNLIIQRLAADLGAEPALTEALLADVRLLADPSAPGRRLLDAFAAAGEQGFTAEWFASADATGSVLETAADANSARLFGYLEVPTNGAYRFFVTLGKKDAVAELRFAHLANPLLQSQAAADGAEASEFVELKAGIPYEFMLEARNLGAGGLSLAVMGENLPKGSLERLTLYPGAVVERIGRAYVLLAKVFEIVLTLGLSEHEMRHLLMHGPDFDNLSLNGLPTRGTDDSDSGAENLFSQFLRVAGYAALKRDLAPDTADLIGVFENARRSFPLTQDATAAKDAVLNELCQRIADITRRKVDTVQGTVRQLGIVATTSSDAAALRVEVPDFAHEKGLARLWRALQIVERLGVSPDAVGRWATPKPDFTPAQNLRDTIRAKYEPEDWQRIAQPIFDKLRQQRRDTLVAYVLHRHPEGFTSANQLFEYFLMDPEMEPVVQTSRIRQAIASVQLFIQRCLLNLEKNVHPSAINSKHWQWMKRYRLWEANRKIFLFPENWLEPEFRDDKTHLFQELEGALLQGDVSNDLVEDAFLTYLKKLEELAWLEIVTMYCEEKAINPAANTAHVIGRTQTKPARYFYRQYAQRMWTPWEPVGVEFDSDHVAAVIWRERLHLFWLEFMEKAKQDTAAADAMPDDASCGQVAKHFVRNATTPKDIEVQLNWSEYFQGQWSERRSSAFITVLTNIRDAFDRQSVSIHVSRDFKEGEETAVRIHLGGVIQKAFKLVSRHAEPEVESAQALPDQPPDQPYGSDSIKATLHTRVGALEVSFHEHFEGILPASGPDVCSWLPGRLDLFVIGSDRALWHCSYFGSWSHWESLGGTSTSDPAAVSWDKGRIDTFARGNDNELGHRWLDGHWMGWESLGGILTSGPAACSWAPGRVDVFVRGTENMLWHKWYENGWSHWEWLGDGLSSDPAAVCWSVGRIDIFVRRLDNALWHKWFDGHWMGWESLGGQLTSAPAVCSWAKGRLDIFVRGNDNALWHKWYDHGWSHWESLGGTLASSPAAVSWGEGRIDVIALGPDDILRHKHFEVEWSEWEEIDSVLAFQPPPGEQRTTKKILQEPRNYSLLLASNPSEYLFPEVGALMRPFFYQDDEHTFFVEPRVTETTIERWEEWVVSTPVLRPRQGDLEILRRLPLRAQIPINKLQLQRDLISPHALFNIPIGADWLSNPRVIFEFDQQKIGVAGRVNAKLFADAAGAGGANVPGFPSPGGNLAKPGAAAMFSTTPPNQLITVGSGKGADVALLDKLTPQSAAIGHSGRTRSL